MRKPSSQRSRILPEHQPKVRLACTPCLAPRLLLGTGLGGFADGILLHQLLQWHNKLSGVRPPADLVAMKFNMVWDAHVVALGLVCTRWNTFQQRLISSSRSITTLLSLRAGHRFCHRTEQPRMP